MTEQERNIIIKTKSIYTWLYTKFPVQPLVKIVLSQTSKHTQKNRFVFSVREFTLRVLFLSIQLHQQQQQQSNVCFKRISDDITCKPNKVIIFV